MNRTEPQSIPNIDRRETSIEMNAGDQNDNDEDAVAAFLFVSGTDARILSLDQLLDSEWYSQPGDPGEPSADGQCVEPNHGAVVICGEANKSDDPMDVVEEWLRQHAETISNLDGTKTLEILSFMPPGIGSKFLVIPVRVVRLCSQLDCKIAHQYVRLPSDDELAAYPSKQK